jgi:hypothetical protein
MTNAINIREISKTIRAAGVKDDMLVYYRMAGGNHTAACMLRHCLIWSSGKKVQDRGGWFYKSDDDWAAEACFTRRKLNKCTAILADLGLLKTDVRQVESKHKYHVGKVVTHYQIFPEQFWNSLIATLQQMKDGIGCANADDQPAMDDLDIDQCADCSPADVQNVHPVTHETAIDGRTERASDGAQNVQMNLSLDSSSESSLQTTVQTSSLSDERDYLSDLANEFDDFEKHESEIREELKRLGRDGFNTVYSRCIDRGVNWAYVLKSLRNERTSPSPSSAAPLPEFADGSRYITGEYADFIVS